MDKISADHLKIASRKLPSACHLFYWAHGVLPTSILCAVSMPIIKNKAGKINSNQNYRPIALASIFIQNSREDFTEQVCRSHFVFIYFIYFLVYLQVKSLRS